MLELAEQVAAGDSADPGRVYLPVGSACTLSGLVLGVALARRLGLPAFRASEFELVGVPIHHLFAAAERALRLHTAAPFSAVRAHRRPRSYRMAATSSLPSRMAAAATLRNAGTGLEAPQPMGDHAVDGLRER